MPRHIDVHDGSCRNSVADPGFLQGGGVRQLVPLECPKPLYALSPSDL